MWKMKQGMAVALTATMVLGSTVTVLAADTPLGTGTTSGAGTSEGHVNKEVVNMVLPTVESGATPFAYTMDPERLIQETNGAKYEDFTFPEKTSDTGVYFLTGEKTYANESNILQAVNKSSCNVTLKVKVKATASAGGKDIALVNAASTSTTTPELYLGLKVGSTNQAVSTTEATVTKTVAGTPTNFETTVQDKAGATDGEKEYVYKEKADATTWKAINISMTGSVNNYAIAADTTAPTVDVTWEYNKAADDATADTDAVDYTATPANAAPEISNVTDFDKAAPENVVISFTLGRGDDAVDADGAKLTYGASKTAVNTAKYQVDMAAKTITVDKTSGFMTGASANIPIYVSLTKGGTAVKELSGTIVVK